MERTHVPENAVVDDQNDVPKNDEIVPAKKNSRLGIFDMQYVVGNLTRRFPADSVALFRNRRPTWLRPMQNDLKGDVTPLPSSMAIGETFGDTTSLGKGSASFLLGLEVDLPPEPEPLRKFGCRWQKRDHSPLERWTNVVTSMPFVAVGLSSPKSTTSAALFGHSLVGVGIASSAYHLSSGQARSFFRWGDYAMIAASSMILSTALRDKNPPGLMAASALLLPFQPMAIIAVHTGLNEATFAKKVISEPRLRSAHRLHTVAAVASGALFVADEVFPDKRFIHAGWHLAAALGTYTIVNMLGKL